MLTAILSRSPIKRLGFKIFPSCASPSVLRLQDALSPEDSGRNTERGARAEEQPTGQLEKLGQIAAASIQLAALGPKLAGLAAEMEKHSQAQARRATSIANTMENLTRDLETAVTELRNSSGQVGDALTTVSRIADHTRIISLNASIEAARAGQHGRAFAVVVEEVQRLADRTGETTHLIEARMGEMKTSIVRVARVTGNEDEAVSQETELRSVESVNIEVHGMAHSAEKQLGGSQSLHRMSDDVLSLAESLLLSVGAFRFDAHARAENEVAALVPLLLAEVGKRHPCEALLERWLSRHPHFELAYVTDARGRQWVDNIESRNGALSHDPSCLGKDWSGRPWYLEAIARKAVCCTDIYRSSATGDFCFTVAAPLHSPAGEFLGVVGVDVNFQKLLQS